MMKRFQEEKTEVEQVRMQQGPTQLGTSTTIFTTTENVVTEVVEHINVLSGVEDATIEFSLPKMTSRDESLSSYAENLGIPVNAGTSILQEEIESKISSDSNLPILKDSTSFKNVRTEVENVGIIIENKPGVQELYLDRVYQKQETQEFYCPNCKTCIQKVLIQTRDGEEAITSSRPQPVDTFRCTSCFSFLIPIGSWLFPSWVPDEDKAPKEPVEVIHVGEPEIKPPAPDKSVVVTDSGKETLKVEQVIIDETKKEEIKIEILQDESAQDISRDKATVDDWRVVPSTSEATTEPNEDALSKEFAAAGWVVASTSMPTKPKETEIDSTAKLDGEAGDSITGPAEEVLPVSIVAIPEEAVVQEPESSKKWEILKSIVYGGLVESIASLSVVTSAASADATTLSIVALALANLIGGLFLLVHHLWELKSEESTKTNTETNAEVDRYYKTLGQRSNFYLHATIAILSFIIFGLVPPIVYGFSFYESNNKDLKLAVVAGASLVCIVLLATAKAYIQKPTKYVTYFTTIMYYVGTGALASIVSYLAGDLIRMLLNKLGWFKSSSSLALPLSEMSVAKSRWGSY